MSKRYTVEDYLSQLEHKLRDLPANERRTHLNEIRDHLMELVAEEGKTEHQIVDSFISPEQLSKDILLEEQTSKQKTEFELPDYWFGVTVVSVVAPFGALALPLIMEHIDIGLYLPFLLQFIVGTIVLFGFYKTRLANKRGDTLRKIGRVMIPVLAIPFAFFSINIMQTGNLSTFKIAYLACYLFTWILTYFSVRNLYLRNIKVVIV
ncbi:MULTISPECIES: HAAS signaling domain-containing protein [Halobacillus]|uniref:HAAS signaling domain-containing protein n=1 Tax=Halobacillus TaxID=45667 RepID=UPI00136851A9|nr:MULTISPECIES: DUF1700 domain-containing protein [Halobacillus]MYL31482.1 DUF1700 domain-containing protein [Halobacillus halophilus]MYL39212.1 DUF1700 domain-containing protein [Halobacillus litoralis]